MRTTLKGLGIRSKAIKLQYSLLSLSLRQILKASNYLKSLLRSTKLTVAGAVFNDTLRKLQSLLVCFNDHKIQVLLLKAKMSI